MNPPLTFPSPRVTLLLSDARGACIWCGAILPPWIEKVRRTNTSSARKAPETGAFLFYKNGMETIKSLLRRTERATGKLFFLHEGKRADKKETPQRAFLCVLEHFLVDSRLTVAGFKDEGGGLLFLFAHQFAGVDLRGAGGGVA